MVAHRLHGRRTAAAAVLPLVLFGASCAVPTDAPIWDTEWTASAGEVSVTAADVLPSDVDHEGSSFRMPLYPTTASFALSEFCPDCPAGQGSKPAFDGIVTFESSSPVEVAGGIVTGGEVRLRVTHDWGFDPLRPGGSESGVLSVEIVDESGQPLGAATLDGAVTDFPSGTSRELIVPVSSAVLQGSGQARLRLASPAGGEAVLNPSAEMSVSVVEGSFLRASELDVHIGDEDVVSDPLALNLTDIDSDVQSRVRQGALVLITNNTLDLGVGGTLEVRPLQGASISKSLAIPKGEQLQRFDLSLSEIQSILGQLIDLRARGTIEGGEGGIVRLRPEDRLDLRLDLELSVRIGG